MPTPQPVSFPSGSLTLEGTLYTTDEARAGSLVVVCHPHPQRGGDMQNNVVMTVVRSLLELGIGALTFNFRGVGRSEGTFDNGLGEQDDVRAALTFARSLDGVKRVALAGYSFGAGIAAAAVDASVPALALVSPASAALTGERATGLREYTGPALIVSGEADTGCSIAAAKQATEGYPGEIELASIPGADHFWWGHEAALRDIVGGFFSRVFVAPA